MLKKKDLAERFGISYKTVKRTFQACGISTRKIQYSDEEVALFTFARLLYQQRKTTKEVEREITKYNGLRSAGSTDIRELGE